MFAKVATPHRLTAELPSRGSLYHLFCRLLILFAQHPRYHKRAVAQRPRLCGVGQHGRSAESVYFARQGQNSGQYGKCSCGRRDEHCAGCAIHKRFPYGCSGRDPGDHPLAGCVRRFCHPLSLHRQRRSAASPAEYSLSWEAPLAVYSAGNTPCADAHVR